MENLLHALAFFGNYNSPAEKKKKNGPRNTEVLYLTKLSIRKGKSKTFRAKQRLKEFIASRWTCPSRNAQGNSD